MAEGKRSPHAVGATPRPSIEALARRLKPHPRQQDYVRALRRYAQPYLRLANVTSVGVGYRIKNHFPQDELCIQFTVQKKYTPEALEAQGLARLPDHIETADGTGIPVDVIERGFEHQVEILEPEATLTVRHARRSRLDPICPGISVAIAGGSAGTIGAIVFDAHSLEPLILSNWHVLAGAKAKAGDAVLQPGPFDGGDHSAMVGRLLRSHLGLAGDCAVASIERRGFDARILERDVIPRRIGKAELGDRLVKSGRTTGVTYGIVSRVGVVVKLNYPEVGEVQIGGFEIMANPDKPPHDGEISMGGDSGSLWMMDDPERADVAVGLHFAGEPQLINQEYALACSMHSVVEKLHLRLSRPAGGVGSGKSHFVAFGGGAKDPRAARPTLAPLGELPALDAEGLRRIEALLESDSEALLERVRGLIDPEMNEDLFRYGLASARALLAEPERLASITDSAALERAGHRGLPSGFWFPGMDPAIGIDPNDRKFEEIGDLGCWILFGLAAILFPVPVEPFRDPRRVASRFPLREPEPHRPTRAVVFGDFGTGLYHSLYIAKQFAGLAPDYAFHCGDVYYAGRESEFENYIRKPLSPIESVTGIFMLNSNHEMLSGGKWYFRYLDDKRARHPGVQQQVGSLFSLESSRFQITGIDTAYHENGRFSKDELKEWLRERLEAGRGSGRLNILLSANEPYCYGKNGFTALLKKDLRQIADRGLIDLWFWGNTHYGALFDRSERTPFIGSCVGHGGFPYKRMKRNKPSPAPLLFLETRARFPESTGVRQDMGNNGYCLMTLKAEGTVTLDYFDWMGNLRCSAEIRRRSADGPARVVMHRVFDETVPSAAIAS